MATQNISIGYDANSAIVAADQLRETIRANNLVFGEFAIKTIEYNKAGELARATITQMANDGKKLATILEQTAQGIERVTTKVTENVRKQADILKQTALAAAKIQADLIINQRAPVSGSSTDIPTAMLERLQRAQQALVKTLAFGGLGKDEVDRVINDLANGIIKVEQGPAAALQRAFLRVLDTARQVNQTLSKQAAISGPNPAAASFAQQVGIAFPVPSGAAPAQLAAYQQALLRVQAAAAQTTLPLAQLQSVLTQVAASPAKAAAGFAQLPPELQRLQQEIIRTAAVAGQNLSAEKIGGALTIGLSTIVRIFQTQFLHRLIGATFNAIQQSIGEAAKLQTQISQIRTISQQSGLTFELTANQVRKLSDEFGKTQTDVAIAAYDALSNQVAEGAKSFEFVREAARFSRISVSSLSDSVNLGSSALKSFNLTTQDSRRVFDQFFKTIDLGRIKASDLANTYGRVGPQAAALGVSIEELNAIIATTSVKGVTPSETLTQISALFTGLIKPSRELKKTYEELGFASGQQAIETIGLSGVLKLLFKELENGPQKLGELFPNIRALRNALANAADAGKSFDSVLAKITGESAKTAAEAFNIIGESAGDQLTRKFNRLKNFFVSDLGNDLVGVLNVTIGGLQKLGSAAGANENIFKTGALVIGGYSGLMLLAGTSSLGLVVRLTALKAAVIGLNPAIAGIALIFGILAKSVLDSQRSFRELSEAGTKTESEFLDRIAKINESQAQLSTQRTQDFKSFNDQAFASTFEAIRTQAVEINKIQDDLVVKNKIVTDALKLQFEGAFRRIKDSINTAKTEATNLQSAVDRSKRSVEEFKARTEERSFERSLQFETDPTRQLQSLENRLRQLNKEIVDLFEKGDEASVRAAEKKTNDLERLLEARAQKELEIRRKIVEAGRGEGFIINRTDSVTGATTRDINAIDIVNRLQRDSTKLIELRTQAEERLQERLLISKKTQEDLVITEQARLDKLQQLGKEIEKTKFLDDQGNLLKQFKDKPELLKGAEEELRQKQAEFEKLLGETGEGRKILTESLSRKVLVATEQAEAALTKIRNEAALQEALDEKKRLAELVAAGDARVIAIRETQQKLITELAKQTATNAKLAQAGPSVTEIAGFPIPIGLRDFSERDKVTRLSNISPQAAKQAEAIQNSLNILLTATDLSAEQFKEILDNNIKKANEFFDNMKRIVTVRRQGIISGETDDKDILRIFPSAKEVEKQKKEFINQLKELEQNRTELDIVAIQKEKITRQAQESAAEFSKQFGLTLKTIQDTTVTTNENLNQVFEKVKGQADSTVIKIESINTAIQAIKDKTIEIKVKTTNPDNLPIGEPNFVFPEFAKGGPTLGRGEHLILAHEGEFIVNAKSTRQFYSQLVQMNHGMAPRRFDQGGPVTNIGDITINAPQGTTTQQALAFAKELKRLVRRKVITLK